MNTHSHQNRSHQRRRRHLFPSTSPSVRRLTVFLVTHDAAVAARADRIVQVEDGRVLDGVIESVPLSA